MELRCPLAFCEHIHAGGVKNWVNTCGLTRLGGVITVTMPWALGDPGVRKMIQSPGCQAPAHQPDSCLHIYIGTHHSHHTNTPKPQQLWMKKLLKTGFFADQCLTLAALIVLMSGPWQNCKMPFPSHRYQKLHMEQLLEVVEASCKNSEVIKLELRGSWWGRYYSTLSRVIAAALNWYVFR